jgi:hypothetical protein
MSNRSLSDQLEQVSPEVRAIVEAARHVIVSAAPRALEIPYGSKPPRSKSYMWKLVRYSAGGNTVVGVGTYAKYSALFFYRGRELEDEAGLLEGSGRDSRFIRLKSVTDAESPAVRRLVEKAFRLPGKLDRPR